MNALRRCTAALLLAGALLPAGCAYAVRGEWSLERTFPDADRFAVNHLVLEKDGAYNADIVIDGRQRLESGRYRCKGLKLYLWPDLGGQRVHPISVRGNELIVRDGERRSILRRVP